MKFDGGKQMFDTDLLEGMRDQGKLFEKICVLFSYVINDQGNDFKRKNGQHCGMLNVELWDIK